MEKSSLLLECFNCARPVSDLNKRRRRVDLRSTNSGVGITRRNGDALMEFILCRWVLNTGMVPPGISALVRRPTTAVDPNVLEISVTLKRILGSASRSQTSRQSWPLAM